MQSDNQLNHTASQNDPGINRRDINSKLKKTRNPNIPNYESSLPNAQSKEAYSSFKHIDSSDRL